MEVAYVWPYLDWGGAQIYFSGIIKLVGKTNPVRAVMPEGSDAKVRAYLERVGARCDFFPAHMDLSPAANAWHKIRRRFRDWRCSWILARHLRRYGADDTILHVDLGPWKWFWLLLYLSFRGDVFLTLHIAIPRQSFLQTARLKTIFAILCRMKRFHLLVSNRDMLESLKPYIPSKEFSSVPVAYTGIDREEIDRALGRPIDRSALCRRFDLPTGKLLVFSLGQVIARKGCFVLLEAIHRLEGQGLPLFFVWIGHGERQAELKARCVEHGLEGSFRLIPPSGIGPDRLDLLELLRLADLFVLPSYSEGLPGALLEAMALGKACIASRVNAVPEAVRDRETGILVPPGDSRALADAIRDLARDDTLRERIAGAGRSFVLSHFDERKAAETTLEYYRKYCPTM